MLTGTVCRLLALHDSKERAPHSRMQRNEAWVNGLCSPFCSHSWRSLPNRPSLGQMLRICRRASRAPATVLTAEEWSAAEYSRWLNSGFPARAKQAPPIKWHLQKGKKRTRLMKVIILTRLMFGVDCPAYRSRAHPRIPLGSHRALVGIPDVSDASPPMSPRPPRAQTLCRLPYSSQESSFHFDLRDGKKRRD